MNEDQNQAGLLKEDKSLMATTVQHGDNTEVECWRIIVQELKNEVKSLSENFKVKFDALKRENTYKD